LFNVGHKPRASGDDPHSPHLPRHPRQ